MTTATLEKVNIKNLEQFVPKTDYLEIRKLSTDDGPAVLEISAKVIGANDAEPNKVDGFVDLEIALRKGIRVGLFNK